MARALPLAAWGLAGPARALDGGWRDVVRVGDVVLKAVTDVEEAEWSAEVLDRLPERGVRIARPLRTLDGRWVAGGFTAHRFVAGEAAPAGRWHEVLEAGRALHRALEDVPRPDFFARRNSRRAIADRVAWGEQEIPLTAAIADLCACLRPRLGPSRARAQAVHGDLSGSTLFAPGLSPAIIDFSPYWRPTGYAEAIVVVDAMLRRGASPSLMDALAGPDAAENLGRAWLLFAAALSQRIEALGDADAAASTARARDVLAEIVRGL